MFFIDTYKLPFTKPEIHLDQKLNEKTANS